MGNFEVYEGEMKKGQSVQKVAIKRIPKIKYQDMAKELQNLCTPLRNSNNVIKLFGCYYENEDYYPLVLELAICDLKMFMENKDGKFNAHWAKITKLPILQDVANGVMGIHHNQPSIMHLDLKPENVLIVDRNGDGSLRACIADFGKSKLTIKRALVATCTGGAVGTRVNF